MSKNTAAAISLAIQAVDPEEIALVTPADHQIDYSPAYVQAVHRAEQLAIEGSLVIFGIVPTSPETGYGYIEAEGEEVCKFHEKPDLNTALKYVGNERFYWNSGMLCFRVSQFREMMKKHAPEILEPSEKAFKRALYQNPIAFWHFDSAKAPGLNDRKSPHISNIRRLTIAQPRELSRCPNVKNQLDSGITSCCDQTIEIKEEDMENIPSLSIDYALLEKSDQLKMVRSHFRWCDLGSFDSLFSQSQKDGSGNVINSEAFYGINAKNNLVISHKLVTVIDVENLAIIDTQDALLVVKLGSSQKIKDLITQFAS